MNFDSLTPRGKQMHEILQRTYATKPRPNTYAHNINVDVAQRLDSLLDDDLDSYRRSRREFINIIWMVWPGGSTAEAVADEILDELGVEFDDRH